MITQNNSLAITQNYPNRFLKLLASPHSRLYSQSERKERAVIINSKRIHNHLLASVLAGVENHLDTRVEAIKKRAAQSQITNNLQINQIIEALYDSHFRKQQHFGPSKEEVVKKISIAISKQEPINLVGMMFTRKNICPLKRGDGDETVTDFAEIFSLVHLNSFAALISKFYPLGVNYIILSEGKRYAKAFDYSIEKAIKYRKNLDYWVKQLKLDHLFVIDYEDFLSKKLSHEESLFRQECYQEELELYKKLMMPILKLTDTNELIQQAITLDPKNDPFNPEKNFIPLWRSILNSLPYEFLQAYAEKKGESYDHVYLNFFKDLLSVRQNSEEENVRQQIIKKSWEATIEHNAKEAGDAKAKIDAAALIGPSTFRTTINPRPGSCLGVYTTRETSARIQPWHGTGFLETDRSGRLTTTVLSRIELESIGAVP